MPHPFISVVIPVYNAEKYLEECVASVLAQSYESFEVILVNDGSRDASGAICDRLAATDDRIHVIHKDNGGAADTRNRGAREAKGNYIAFIDADDFVSPEYLSYLVELMNTYRTRIPVCDAFWTEKRSVDFDTEAGEIIPMDARQAGQSVIGPYGLKMLVPWGKLLPRELVLQHPFPVGRRVEDEATLYKILYDGGGAVLSLRRLYGYYQNEAGLMHQVNEKHRLDYLTTARERWQFFEEKGEKDLAVTMYGYYVNSMITNFVRGHRDGLADLYKVGFSYLFSGVRPLYAVNFLLFKLFRMDFITWLDSHRK